MALVTIPLRAEPSQEFSIILEGQNVTLRFFTREYPGAQKLYCDAAVDGVPVWYGHICRHFQDVRLYEYLPLAGVMRFVDMQGDADPEWQGLGERWQLLYGLAADWEALANG